MDWISLASAVGVSTILTTVVTGILNRRINKANADNTTADYTEKIIKQCDERVDQALADYQRAIKERDEAYQEAKGQRKAKQEWREKALDLERENHVMQLTIKDKDTQLKIAEYHRCEMVACASRIPPRVEDGDK